MLFVAILGLFFAWAIPNFALWEYNQGFKAGFVVGRNVVLQVNP